MDHIDSFFTNVMSPSSKNSIAICAAIKVSKQTLNQYYSLTDSSEIYRIAMGPFTPYSYHLIFIVSHVWPFQSFIHVTSCGISRWLVGMKNGSTPRRTSFVSSLSCDMLHEQWHRLCHKHLEPLRLKVSSQRYVTSILMYVALC